MPVSSNRTDPRTPRARSLRRSATIEERRVWAHLKQWDDKGHFRRQVPIGPYFADFAHLGARLVVEIDGGQHNGAMGEARDSKRTAWLESQGFEVIRFWNSDVRFSLDSVMDTIRARLDARLGIHPPTPTLPAASGGRETIAGGMPTDTEATEC